MALSTLASNVPSNPVYPGGTRMKTPPRLVLLFVDDEPDHHTLLGVALSKSTTLTITHAYDGKQALDRVRWDRPDAILADIMMPVMDGLMMARQLGGNAVTCDIPIIFLTAKALPCDIRRGDALAVGYITKPFDACTIENQILDILRAHTVLLD
jgi:putative two-component system response regulator